MAARGPPLLGLLMQAVGARGGLFAGGLVTAGAIAAGGVLRGRRAGPRSAAVPAARPGGDCAAQACLAGGGG